MNIKNPFSPKNLYWYNIFKEFINDIQDYIFKEGAISRYCNIKKDDDTKLISLQPNSSYIDNYTMDVSGKVTTLRGESEVVKLSDSFELYNGNSENSYFSIKKNEGYTKVDFKNQGWVDLIFSNSTSIEYDITKGLLFKSGTIKLGKTANALTITNVATTNNLTFSFANSSTIICFETNYSIGTYPTDKYLSHGAYYGPGNVETCVKFHKDSYLQTANKSLLINDANIQKLNDILGKYNEIMAL